MRFFKIYNYLLSFFIYNLKMAGSWKLHTKFRQKA
jgi:hypothetical protein